MTSPIRQQTCRRHSYRWSRPFLRNGLSIAAMADNVPFDVRLRRVRIWLRIGQRHASVVDNALADRRGLANGPGSVHFRWAPLCFLLSSAWLSTLWDCKSLGATGVILASADTAALLAKQSTDQFSRRHVAIADTARQRLLHGLFCFEAASFLQRPAA